MQTAKAAPALVVVIATIVACLSAGVVLTAGRAAALERDVLASVDDAGVRTIVLASNRIDGGLDPSVVDRIGRLSGVEWVVGFGAARDVSNAAIPGGRPVASRTVYGDWKEEIVPVEGVPRPGAAMVSRTSERMLGLAEPAGAVLLGEDSVPVVGRFAVSGALSEMRNFVILVPEEEQPSDSVALVYVLADRAGAVAGLAEGVRALAGEPDQSTLNVSTSDRLIRVQAALSGQLAGLSRQSAAAMLGGGLVVVALCMIMMSTLRRRDFGRRRALGASRVALTAVVALTVLVPSTIGVAVGTPVGLALLAWRHQPVPDLKFLLASTILIVLVTVVGAVPGAVLAAWRDPALVLRVP